MNEPIGVMPKGIWEQQCRDKRIIALLEAMFRYADDNKPAPPAWITELGELLEASSNHHQIVWKVATETPQSKQTFHRLGSQQMEKLIKQMAQPLLGVELSGGDVESLVTALRVHMFARMRP